ncbi:MAG: ABC transporter permease [Gordonia sp. (in: high G+C Gram-positive bacteria)]
MLHRRILLLWLTIVMVILVLPLLAMAVMSFNESRYGTLPFHFSFHWYGELSSDTALIDSLKVSVNLALQVTVISVVVGTALAFGLVRVWPWISVSTNSLLLTVITVPGLILSAGMLRVFDLIGLRQSQLALILASVVTSLPFVVMVVGSRVKSLDPVYADAARTLGAGPIRTFLRITVPLIAPALISGAMLAFVMCFNNFAIQLFLAPIGLSTLPVQIYSMVRLGVTPDVNALGTIIVTCTVLIILILNAVTGNAARLFSPGGQELFDEQGKG